MDAEDLDLNAAVRELNATAKVSNCRVDVTATGSFWHRSPDRTERWVRIFHYDTSNEHVEPLTREAVQRAKRLMTEWHETGRKQQPSPFQNTH